MSNKQKPSLSTLAERFDCIGYHFGARCLRKAAILAGETDGRARQ